MDGFIDLFTELIKQAGIEERFLFEKKAVELLFLQAHKRMGPPRSQ